MTFGSTQVRDLLSHQKLPPTADGKQTQGPTDRSAENERLYIRSPKWDVSIKSLPSGLRELHGRVDKNSVRARGDGGHQETRPLNQHCAHIYELTDTEAECTGPVWICTRRVLKLKEK